MPQRPLIYVIATQHLDVAYLWRRSPEGEDLMLQCFARAVEMMDAHPEVDFLFSRSTAWSFDLLQRRDPTLFARVSRAVEGGRLELCGGQWVEPDNILPDGESLVRQALYGQRYYLDTFGRASRVSWNPDAFAHGHTLPQLFSRAGLEAYYFHRCVPTDAEGQRLDRFVWEGCDGSRVLVLAGHWRGRPDAEVLDDRAAGLARTARAVGFIVTGANSDRRVTMEEDWVPLLPREAGGYEARWATSEQLADALTPELSQLPVVRGELGWQFTGTYTTEGNIKRRNRRLEARLDSVERLWTGWWARGGEYPAGELRHLRRELCVNQFHDIVCGTCYQHVHDEAFELYDEIETRAQELAEAGLAQIGLAQHRLAQTGPEGHPGEMQDDATAETGAGRGGAGALLLYNPLGQPHRSPIALPAARGEPGLCVGGQRLPSQRTAEGDGVVFLPPPMEALSCCAVAINDRGRGARQETACTKGAHDVDRSADLRPPSDAMGPVDGVPADAPSSASTLVLENPWLRAEFCPDSGDLVRLLDRPRGEDVLSAGSRGNRLVFYADRTPLANFEPWYIGYTGEILDGGLVEEVRLIEDGPVRARLQTRRRLRLQPDMPETVLIQDALLYKELPWLVFETRGEWWADGVLLKAEFDLSFSFDEVAADMPYGVALRPAVRDTTAFQLGVDAAVEDGLPTDTRVEEPDRPMHKWLDASDGSRGLAFLNDGRYGYDADGQSVRLSLMRAPRHRDGELVGIGPFEPFSYALMPHRGDWRAARLPQLGLAYNYPLLVGPGSRHWADAASPDGSPLDGPGLVSIDADTVLITAIKRSETGDHLVLRLYESTGTACTTRLGTTARVAAARVADLIERPTGDAGCLLVDDRHVEVSLGPFELKTLLLDLDPS